MKLEKMNLESVKEGVENMKEGVRQGINSLWDSVSDGWQRLKQTSTNAVIRFDPTEGTNLPDKSQVDDDFYMPAQTWGMLGGDVYEDDKRLVVRVELPGMEKENFRIEIKDNALVISGEKQFEHEESEGRWRVLQCAYGSFNRVVALPSSVMTNKASATYKNGVLRVELPKVVAGKAKANTIKVN